MDRKASEGKLAVSDTLEGLAPFIGCAPEALRETVERCNGLYVTGDNASNWMGEEYGPMFSSFCWAMNSGFLAGEEAAEYISGR